MSIYHLEDALMSFIESSNPASEESFEAEVLRRLSELTAQFNWQNGRVGRVETLADAHETSIGDLAEADDEIRSDIIGLRNDLQAFDARLEGIPAQTAALVRENVKSELQRSRIEQDAARLQQLKAVGWRIILGIASSSVFIGWILGGTPTP